MNFIIYSHYLQWLEETPNIEGLINELLCNLYTRSSWPNIKQKYTADTKYF